MSEQVVGTAKSYSTGKPDSIVIVMPKELRPKKGQHFIVKRDENGRVIYEPIEKRQS